VFVDDIWRVPAGHLGRPPIDRAKIQVLKVTRFADGAQQRKGDSQTKRGASDSAEPTATAENAPGFSRNGGKW
jgi:hypothetical protein